MTHPGVETDFAVLLQHFFYRRLIAQRRASPATIASYRETFRLLLDFAQRRLGRPAARLHLAQLDAPLIAAFLDALEVERHNSVRSRNARLAAIHSFMHFAAIEQPAALPQIQRILAIPAKRFNRRVVGFLSRAQIEALLDAPDAASWSGQRDRVLLMTLYNTGARVSEIIGIRAGDFQSEGCAAVCLHGKGRKERIVPLWRRTRRLLCQWRRRLNPTLEQRIFPNHLQQPMTRSGVAKRLEKAVCIAVTRCPSLKNTHVSPHVIRHYVARATM